MFEPDLPDTAFIDPKLPGTSLERSIERYIAPETSWILDVTPVRLQVVSDFRLVLPAEAAEAPGCKTVTGTVKSDGSWSKHAVQSI